MYKMMIARLTNESRLMNNQMWTSLKDKEEILYYFFSFLTLTQTRRTNSESLLSLPQAASGCRDLQSKTLPCLHIASDLKYG